MVEPRTCPIEPLGLLLLPGRSDRLAAAGARARDALAGRVVWNVTPWARLSTRTTRPCSRATSP